MDNISLYPFEKEILFLPFSCFEILSVTPFLIEEKTKVKSISNKKKVKYYILQNRQKKGLNNS